MDSARRNVLRTSALAAALMTNGMLAMASGSSGTDTSIAFCSVKSTSQTLAISQDAYTEAWLDVGEYVCGSDPVVTDISVQVEKIAFAIAEAFAEVTAFCSAQGNAEVRAQGYAFAEERATAIGDAIADIFATSSACGNCDIAISATSSAAKELVAHAVAEAWTEIYIYSDSGSSVPEEEYSQITSRVIVENIQTVLSSITGTIRAGAEDGCNIDVINEASVGDYFGICEISASGDNDIIETDAMAQAGADARAYACDGDRAEAQADVIAKATAVAMAQAIAQVDVYCESAGPDSSACGLGVSEVEAVARAQAEAFAEAYAEAETCGCKVAAHASTSIWAEIWVEVAVNAYAEACAFGDDYAFDTDFQFAVEERMIFATARAIARAVADAEAADECNVFVSPCSSGHSECVPRNQKCGGRDFDYVLPCCDPDYRCFERNSNDFRCRHRNWNPPSFWTGVIQECSADQAEA